jgi:hypothetical protein
MQNATVLPSVIIHKPRRPGAWIGKVFLIILALGVAYILGKGLIKILPCLSSLCSMDCSWASCMP